MAISNIKKEPTVQGDDAQFRAFSKKEVYEQGIKLGALVGTFVTTAVIALCMNLAEKFQKTPAEITKDYETFIIDKHKELQGQGYSIYEADEIMLSVNAECEKELHKLYPALDVNNAKQLKIVTNIRDNEVTKFKTAKSLKDSPEITEK